MMAISNDMNTNITQMVYNRCLILVQQPNYLNDTTDTTDQNID